MNTAPIQPNDEAKNCRECGQDFVPMFLPELVNVCPECSERHAIEDGQRMAAEAQARSGGAWRALCPEAYQATVANRIPAQRALAKALAWNYGARGLILHGPTGAGKSRAAWLVLKRECDAGRRIKALDHSVGYRYAETFTGSPAEAARWIDHLIAADLVLFDDVFKSKLTDSLEQAIFTVIAGRMEAMRPVIVTTNDTGSSLASRMSPDRGQALVRRLTENNTAIYFSAKPA